MSWDYLNNLSLVRGEGESTAFCASSKSMQVALSFWYFAYINSIGIGKIIVRFEKAMNRSNGDGK